jgi:hypothetical protein
MTDPIFGHKRLDVYRLSIAYVGFAYGIAKTLTVLVAEKTTETEYRSAEYE